MLYFELIVMHHFTKSYHHVISSFAGFHILVIGDLILDVYLKGSSTRLSPEAPVPVVDVTEIKKCLGGAANTVCNLRALGARVSFCTVIGPDAYGDEGLKLLQNIDVDAENIIRDEARETLVKTRVCSGDHIITRIDQGTSVPLLASDKIIETLRKAYQECDAVIISDYDKGVITDEVLNELIRLKEAQPKFIAVDSKRLSFFKRLQPSLMKPNYQELIRITGLRAASGADRILQIKKQAHEILRILNSECVVVTLDAEGSMIVENNGTVSHHPALRVLRPSVSGAGDTYLSAFSLAYLVAKDFVLSAEIATAAASIAISKESTASCSGVELRNHFHLQHKLVESYDDLQALCEHYRSEGRKIVFTNGCFDILHSGHVTYLHCAKEKGDVLIVGLNSDESIKRIKGNTRPINSFADRQQVLAGLASVDHIVAFGDEQDDTPVSLIKIVRPHIFVKGGDYTEDMLPEANTVKANGGEIFFMPHIPDHSTTSIISRISGKSLTTVVHGTLE
jgi:D-beta-D-heptose 7-phosphate kinase/D-beta-D-heptose 1-phosphate adenosyltransferase